MLVQKRPSVEAPQNRRRRLRLGRGPQSSAALAAVGNFPRASGQPLRGLAQHRVVQNGFCSGRRAATLRSKPALRAAEGFRRQTSFAAPVRCLSSKRRAAQGIQRSSEPTPGAAAPSPATCGGLSDRAAVFDGGCRVCGTEDAEYFFRDRRAGRTARGRPCRRSRHRRLAPVIMRAPKRRRIGCRPRTIAAVADVRRLRRHHAGHHAVGQRREDVRPRRGGQRRLDLAAAVADPGAGQAARSCARLPAGLRRPRRAAHRRGAARQSAAGAAFRGATAAFPRKASRPTSLANDHAAGRAAPQPIRIIDTPHPSSPGGSRLGMGRAGHPARGGLSG